MTDTLKMLSTNERRLQAETKMLQRDHIDGITVWPHETELGKFTAAIQGPADTPYHDGVFRLSIDCGS